MNELCVQEENLEANTPRHPDNQGAPGMCGSPYIEQHRLRLRRVDFSHYKHCSCLLG